MRKYVLILVTGILLLHLMPAYSQKQDYIETDTSFHSGVNLQRNSRQINSQYVISNGQTYTPDQLTRYVFKDGTVYESKKIIINNTEHKVFMERLAQGKITLYQYAGGRQSTFYVMKDSAGIEELDKDLEVLKVLSIDSAFRNSIRVASY